jgi:hypothetical protein
LITLVSSIVVLACLASSVREPQQPAQAQRIPVEAVDAMIQRGAAWLRGQQLENGAFARAGDRDVCSVAISAMATWSLNEPEPRCLDEADADRAARYLLSNRREDGGIYDPARGLAVYTSGVSVRALRTLGKREQWPELASSLSGVELFSYRHSAPESFVDAAKAGEIPTAHSSSAARELLREAPPTDAARRKALEFLASSTQGPVRSPSRMRTPFPAHAQSEIGPFSYDDLLPFVYAELAPEQQIALRARAALIAYYTPDRNPDLTRRYGTAGFQAGTQALFYYYFVVARTLTTFSQTTLVTADGTSHDWANEISARLLRLQQADGSWRNADPVWWEGEPVLTTSYALLTLKLCRASLLRAGSKQ